MRRITRITVMGGGAWGTALAQAAAQADLSVTLWAREPEVADAVNRQHVNPIFLPGVDLHPTIRATEDILAAQEDAEVVFLATPAQHTREIVRQLPSSPAPLVICAKGLEAKTGLLLSDVLAEERPQAAVLALSGPSFAHEVARRQPTAVTLACRDRTLGQDLMLAVGSRTFRPYWTDDVIGTQLGGAIKNVLSIAAGVVEGRGLGDNARAALITRGLTEMVRLSEALGARPETLMGLSGLGDLLLTSTSLASRNMSFGFKLGRGASLKEILSTRTGVTEGVFTAAAVARHAEEHGVEAPICAAIHRVLSGEASLDETIAALLDRPFKPEWEGKGISV